MEITTELLQTIRQRASQYFVTAFNNGEPDKIIIEPDGSIQAVWRAYSREYDDDCEYISVEKLSADLDEVYKERVKKEEERQRIESEKRRIDAIRREEQEKERRRTEYLKLKKEFDK